MKYVLKLFLKRLKFLLLKELKKKFLLFFFTPIKILTYFHIKIPFFKKKSIFRKPVKFIFKVFKRNITPNLIFFFKKKFVFFTNRFFKKIFFYINIL